MQQRFGARSTALEVVAGVDLRGKRAVVTGGAAGIGLETTRALAVAGAHVTMAVRRPAQGEAAAAQLRAAHPGISVDARPLDLADLASVAAFAAAWDAAPLHILVDNAGIMACPETRTPAGWELQLATNHLGHAALTRALLPALRRAAPARVVVLSSGAHKLADVDLDDPHFARRPYSKWKAYGQAKTFNALMAVSLDAHHHGDGIEAFSVHPGGIMTGLQQHLPRQEMEQRGWFKPDGTPADMFKTVAQGASTSTWAATAPELAGFTGRYLEDCGLAVPATPDTPWSGHAPYIVDRAHAEAAWAWTIAQLGGAFP